MDYVNTQLGTSGDEINKLREIDIHFDPYSDTADSDYAELRETVEKLEVQALLDLELKKGQPDAYLVTQIGRTLKLHPPLVAKQLCTTLLNPKNLHAFRASWSTIMRGIASVRADETFTSIFNSLDKLLDEIPQHSPHLLLPEANSLHFLRAIRFCRTQKRAEYVLQLHSSASSETVKRACIDCWRHWEDRVSFIRLRNMWNSIRVEEQRMIWLASFKFGDEGEHFRNQVRGTLANAWRLGIERNNKPTFSDSYMKWSPNAV